MTYQLTKVGPERATRTSERWLAIYRTPIGFIHKVLPLTLAEHGEEEARTYALANAPGPEEYAR